MLVLLFSGISVSSTQQTTQGIDGELYAWLDNVTVGAGENSRSSGLFISPSMSLQRFREDFIFLAILFELTSTIWLDAKGAGMISVGYISKGEHIMSIPLSRILSNHTCTVNSKFGTVLNERNFHLALHSSLKGELFPPPEAVILTLCVMYEESIRAVSKYGPYLASLPTSFDTPLHWGNQDMQQLQGTGVPEIHVRRYHTKELCLWEGISETTIQMHIC